MNEFEDWFVNTFGRYGFILSSFLIYDHESYIPRRIVTHPKLGILTLRISVEMAWDLSNAFNIDGITPLKEIFMEEMVNRYGDYTRGGDFKPIKKLSKWEFV